MCIHEGFNSFEICGEDLNDICGDVSCLRQCEDMRVSMRNDIYTHCSFVCTHTHIVHRV